MSELVSTPEETPAGAAPIEKAVHRSIPSLDGFRSIAVLFVFIAHAGLDHIFPGGFGVTLFFFLSGYLITTLMRIEHQKTGIVNIKHFYMRRLLRIVPPLYITTTIAILLVVFQIVPSNTEWLAAASHYLFFTNYYGLLSTNDGITGCSPQWSLAVEEHFYLLFPLVFSYFLVKRNATHQAYWLFGFCAVVLAHRTHIASLGQYGWTYLSTDCRLDSIAFGCILALWKNPVLDDNVRENPGSIWWFFGGLATLLFCFAYRDQFFRESFRYTLQGLALMPVFIWAIVRYDKFPFTLLNNKFMKWTAAFSYTIYLVHYIVFYLVEEWVTKDALAKGFISGVAILIYAYLMYVLIEKPTGKMRKRYA